MINEALAVTKEVERLTKFELTFLPGELVIARPSGAGLLPDANTVVHHMHVVDHGAPMIVVAQQGTRVLVVASGGFVGWTLLLWIDPVVRDDIHDHAR